MTLKHWHKTVLLVLGVVAIFYGMVALDVMLRAREAWMEGEQYWRWSEHPEERQHFLQRELDAEEIALRKKQITKQLSEADYARDKELLEFRFAQMRKESTIKYAYIWYQTAVELFSPPNSKWVRLARQKMPAAKERWKAELTAQKIPFENYMID